MTVVRYAAVLPTRNSTSNVELDAWVDFKHAHGVGDLIPDYVSAEQIRTAITERVVEAAGGEEWLSAHILRITIDLIPAEGE